MSTALVAGAAAVLTELRPFATPDDVKGALVSTTAAGRRFAAPARSTSPPPTRPRRSSAWRQRHPIAGPALGKGEQGHAVGDADAPPSVGDLGARPLARRPVAAGPVAGRRGTVVAEARARGLEDGWPRARWLDGEWQRARWLDASGSVSVGSTRPSPGPGGSTSHFTRARWLEGDWARPGGSSPDGVSARHQRCGPLGLVLENGTGRRERAGWQRGTPRGEAALLAGLVAA